MGLIDHIQDLYEGRRTRIEVPEWGKGGIPLTMFAKPYTIADEHRISRWMDKNDSEGFAAVVIMKAEDEDGARLFQGPERVHLVKRGDAEVVKRIAIAIMNSAPSIEEAEGNSGTTPD